MRYGSGCRRAPRLGFRGNPQVTHEPDRRNRAGIPNRTRHAPIDTKRQAEAARPTREGPRRTRPGDPPRHGGGRGLAGLRERVREAGGERDAAPRGDGRRPVPAPAAEPASEPARGPVEDPLTAREHEIVRLIARGHTNVEIGAELFITPGTAKTHIANIQAKLRVRNRVGIAAWAWEHGHVSPRG
ncbi:response regulator transcription factor [Embleya sp. NBC_00896]|uniref:helix-turn-helix transcriptional regulator n=1 Tax=Embleya sp. NBC_00896 TaxID=2975961 RepID=UPI00386D84A7